MKVWELLVDEKCGGGFGYVLDWFLRSFWYDVDWVSVGV